MRQWCCCLCLATAALLAAGSLLSPRSQADAPSQPNPALARPNAAALQPPTPKPVQVAAPTAPAVDEEPLLLLDDPPLLLLDRPLGMRGPTPDGPIPGTPSADNSRCQVCHLNLIQEELAFKHARANVGCAKCHGDCDAHIADESWASGGNGTPPEIMYPRDRIGTGCLACHKPEDVFLKSEKHKPDVWLIAYEVKTCTECHGQFHRIPVRKCRWK
ncbi:MAG: hypothetical protein FJ387_01020 [Verrucomicrobia bacterium]|nr:hypothetical protein [Verrucomicrobiota bacterium]